MASKFRCDCGASVRTNLFEGHGVYVLVAEKHVEEDRSDDDANACLDRIVRNGTLVAECPSCRRLALIDSRYNVRLYPPSDGAVPLAEFVRRSEDV